MSGFTESALEKRLTELNGSQQCIQTLSLWLIHHRKHYKTVVPVWYKQLKKAKGSHRLTFMYLANDVIQNSRKKGPEFCREFGNVMPKAFHHVTLNADDKTLNGLQRLLNVWEERTIYSDKQIQELKTKMGATKSANTEKAVEPPPVKKKKVNTEKAVELPLVKKKKVERMEKPGIEPTILASIKEEFESGLPCTPPEPDELIRAIQDLENSASSDAMVREKIASLPPEVSDVTLLDKLSDKEAANRLATQVDEACTLLGHYNSQLSSELEDRKKLSQMLHAYIRFEHDDLTKAESHLEEFKDKFERVTKVRNELKSHLQNLPDLTRLPDVTGGLAPLPSAGDLFSRDKS